MNYFWADTHFGHAGIIKHVGRRDPSTGLPFADAGAMNEWLISLWNARVERESDSVFVLGDFAFHNKQTEPMGVIFHRLRGKKYLVIGNHDERNPEVLKLPWEWQKDLYTFRDNGRKARCLHYPMETWSGAHRGDIHLHGHSHGSLKRVIPHRFDVGVDTELGAGGPIDFETIWEIAQKQPYQAQDHHAEKKPEVEL